MIYKTEIFFLDVQMWSLSCPGVHLTYSFVIVLQATDKLIMGPSVSEFSHDTKNTGFSHALFQSSMLEFTHYNRHKYAAFCSAI